MGMVFQSFKLFPHKTVLENLIEAPCVVKRLPYRAAVALAEKLLANVDLSDKRAAAHAFWWAAAAGHAVR